jgi:hypothetical protein
MPFKQVITVYTENRTKPTNTPCGQNAELLDVKVNDNTSYKRVLSGNFIYSHFVHSTKFDLLFIWVRYYN